MTSLEEYLTSDYLTNRQDIAALDDAIAAAARTLLATRCPNGWPYEHTFKGPVEAPAKISQGTSAMVLSAIGRVLGSWAFGKRGTQIAFKDQDFVAQLRSVFEGGLSQLSASFSGPVPKLASSSFGDDNPLTLSHVADLLYSLKNDFDDPAQRLIESGVKSAKDKLNELVKNPFGSEQLLAATAGTYQRNTFVPLRAIRAARFIATDSNLDCQRGFFETTLHEQLSFSAIPDSRFDPAELVFALEGLLICAEHAVDAAVLFRVIEVLADKQNTSSHWRPNKPFLAVNTGAIVLPVSVEVANSLMRSIALMDRGRTHDTYTSKSLPLVRRFWGWIQARAVRDVSPSDEKLGWHSEHINVPDLVHTWDTSQVLEFMVAYRELLEREIRTTALRLSGLVSKAPEATELSPADQWRASAKRMDPGPSGPSQERVYDLVEKHFVTGWASGTPNNFSMLLYGPPGTGKTSVAKELSKALGMPLITVTVSDFLGSGGANVEARAKAIFQTLEHQRDVVILFDEIDSFLLDRDSKLYRDQDSLFQFLTPGMLPKIHDLHDAKRSIFIIATNYENRIDPAIKRAGRIDQSYLFPLPDAERRKEIMKEAGFPERYFDEEVKKNSVFLGYGDLVKVVRDLDSPQSDESKKLPSDDKTSKNEEKVAIDFGSLSFEKVAAEKLGRIKRASSLATYINRVQANEADFAPIEFDDMVRLANEAGASDLLRNAKASLNRLKETDAVQSLLSETTKKILEKSSKEESSE